jgi:hypothetical protein
VPTPTSKLFQPTASANPTSSIDQPAWSFIASEPINSLPVVTSPIRDLQVSTAGIFAHALENEDTTTETQLNDGQNSVAIEDSPSEEASIDDLLRLAEEAFVEHRLLSPESDNAYLYYMQVLKRDKGNRQALNGLNQIVSRYIWWAEQDYKKGDYRRSGIFVDRALTISPGDVDAMAMRQRIIKAVAAKSSRISNKGHHSSNSTEVDDFRSTKRDQNFQHYWEMLDMP